MRKGTLKCSLSELGLSNTMTKSARLQMPILNRLNLNSLFPRWRSLCLPHGPRRRNRWSLVGYLLHPDTSHPLVDPVAQPLAGRLPNASNTRLEPRVPTAPTVPVVSTSLLPHETPRSLLTDPHPQPPSPLVSSLPARGPAPSPTSPVASIIAPLPRHAASYNHLESWNVGLTDMEL